MRYLLRLLSVAVFMLPITLNSVAGEKPSVNVSLPVQGTLLVDYGGGESILLVDTFNGTVQPLVDDGFSVKPSIFSPDGNQIAYFSNVGNIPQNRHNVILDITSGNRETVTAFGTNDNFNYPIRWSITNNSILYYTQEIAIGELPKYRFEKLNLATEEIEFLREYTIAEVLSGFNLPFDAPGISIEEILNVMPNPVYDSWVALVTKGINTAIIPDLHDYQGDYPKEAIIHDVILWNYESQEMISVGAVLDKQLDTSGVVAWSSDGKQLMVSNIYDQRTYRTTQYAFTQFNNVGSLTWLKEADVEPYVIFWLGVEDLVVARQRDPQTDDRVFYIGQIIDGQWHSTEFLRFPDADFPDGVGFEDWHLLASDEEKHTLSCIFDETLPVQLKVGGRGWVAIVDGTPRNLQAEPGIFNEVITQISEHTSFDVIGAPWCADGQRWWQIQLADGTSGYAAEASTDTYFLEPLPSGD